MVEFDLLELNVLEVETMAARVGGCSERTWGLLNLAQELLLLPRTDSLPDERWAVLAAPARSLNRRHACHAQLRSLVTAPEVLDPAHGPAASSQPHLTQRPALLR